MQTVPLSDFKAHLSENVERVQVEHEQFTITRNGRPAVVVVSVDEWESLQETLFWRSQPGILEEIAEAANDDGMDEAALRTSLGLRSSS